MTVADSKNARIASAAAAQPAPRAPKAQKEAPAQTVVEQVVETEQEAPKVAAPEAKADVQPAPAAAPQQESPKLVFPMSHTLDDMLTTAPALLTAISRNRVFVEAHPGVMADLMKAVNMILGNREAIQAVYSPVKLADLLVKFSTISVPLENQSDAATALLSMKAFIAIVPDYVNDKLQTRARRQRWMNRALFGIGAINVGVLTYTGGRKLYDHLEKRRGSSAAETAALAAPEAEDTSVVVALPAPQAVA